MAFDAITVIRSTAQDGRTRDLRYKQRQLRSLHEWVSSHSAAIEVAVQQDYNFSVAEAQCLMSQTLNEARIFYDQLDLQRDLNNEYRLRNGQSNEARRVSVGLTYVIPEKWGLFFNAMSVLYACIAAGSCCVIELPDSPTASTYLLSNCLREALDPTAFFTLSTRPDLNVLFHFLVVDQNVKVFQKGLQSDLETTGRAVAASIVDRTANLKLAAQEVLKSALLFSKRGPYAPICVLVNEFVEAKFIALLHEHSKSFSRTDRENGRNTLRDPQGNGDKHRAILDEEDILASGLRLVRLSERRDLWTSQQHWSASTLLVLATSSHDDAIDALNATNREALLALYIFADPAAAKYLAQFINTKVSFVNYVPAHILAWPAAPDGHAFSPYTLYDRATMEIPSPQFAMPENIQLNLQDFTQKTSQSREALYLKALQPLKSNDQPEPRNKNFFSQGLLAGVVLVVLPVLSITTGSLATLIIYLWKRSA
ncbi:hypothetical protein LTR84_003746 [Exophiala bonariae]|uniref:Aldehyde dehydrogenase domain-containing protein n=1 Tax=Exophiala bonariae TaxID=1690606 RepID=A0AAV9N9L0_9EURO|nr:hypothetical protein LTR84_003746 [Exophiala bonariae]